MTPSSRDQLIALIAELHPTQVDLLREMATAMLQEVQETVNRTSDIVVPNFNVNFRNRLLVHHATNEAKLTKKAFEYAFCGASRAAGRRAMITANPVYPGRDVVVDETAYSLKTEAAAGISATRLTISKLMEARWIRECRTGDDFARETTRRVMEHLDQYERIVVLRGFDAAPCTVRYDLVEIPLPLLRRVRHLTAADFSPRTQNGSSRAIVRVDGRDAFSIRLDGSVEKITVSGLQADRCVPHAVWRIPTRVAPSSEDELELPSG